MHRLSHKKITTRSIAPKKEGENTAAFWRNKAQLTLNEKLMRQPNTGKLH